LKVRMGLSKYDCPFLLFFSSAMGKKEISAPL
jgi:hypothetical protein